MLSNRHIPVHIFRGDENWLWPTDCEASLPASRTSKHSLLTQARAPSPPLTIMHNVPHQGLNPALAVGAQSLNYCTAREVHMLTILLLISWKWISHTFSTMSSLSNVTAEPCRAKARSEPAPGSKPSPRSYQQHSLPSYRQVSKNQ